MSQNDLTFTALRDANTPRVGHDSYGRCKEWKLSAWSNATLGELGEAANIIKKIERGDMSLDQARESLGKEFADVVIYLDILSMKIGIDLGEAVRNKFNEVSDRIGSPIKL